MVPILVSRGTAVRTSDGRGLMRLYADGENVGARPDREGLAKLYFWRSETVDWCTSTPARRPRK